MNNNGGFFAELLGLFGTDDDGSADCVKSMYGLTDEEAELVKRGDAYPWSFEEEGEFEDDDYYGEDD